MKRLLNFKTCDSEIKAKRDWNGDGESGITPYELAVKHGCQCQSLLQDHTNNLLSAAEMTFIKKCRGDDYLKNGVPYFDLSASFLRHDILEALELGNSNFLQVTEKIYTLLETDWTYMQHTVKECLYPLDKLAAEDVELATTSSELKKAMIFIYTCDSVYRQANAALRRASETEFHVSDDLLLSLYSLFLTSILLHWKELESIQQTTYRGLTLPVDQAKLYGQGTTFHWLPFTSSTRVKKQAKQFLHFNPDAAKALFVIDNSCTSLWSPRDIVPFSVNGFWFLEVVHPPCARFHVTNVKELVNYTEYNIRLLAPGV